ncbi:oxygen-independent coproporphyrinogen III oxidase [Moraxellaceae bacterium AER2_44_116]|nr:oxygen-independent coproporphyrinogen III oxidase [Moraxellaceae bacterium]TQC99705.1 oxygen-independent coproporphyrinogen III oxidase [Moraxellaceae bacterium AER2_44_116]
MNSSIEFDVDLIQRYDLAGPRYTSYPTAVQFHNQFDETEYLQAIHDSNNSQRPLSLYVHLPFCGTVCYYCACNKIITANRKRASPYLDDLHQEIELQAARFTEKRPVSQLHFGGGTPTFISDDEITSLMNKLRQHFYLLEEDKGDYSIEIDPREVTPAKIVLLRKLGFNRMSFGVQDFDPKVQVAVNRIQSLEQTAAAVDTARASGFHSINIDLIYGLPFQTVESFALTLDKVLALNPDRLSVFNYAHLPHLFKVQKQMDENTLPSAATKLAILQYVIERLQQAGYVYIGMDHFAKPDDELALAQENGTLYRNFQGYSTHAGCDLIGLGITSIGMVDDTYSQNVKTLEEYHECVSTGKLPVYRGVRLTSDDKLRRALITQLICLFKIDISSLEQTWNIDFADYFAEELRQLAVMANDGLITLDKTAIQVLPRGRLLIRNICMVFDSYLRQGQQQRFSKVI